MGAEALQESFDDLGELRSDISAINSKLRALDYGVSSDTTSLKKEIRSIREQSNMTLHYVSHIEDIHEASLRMDQTVEKLEKSLTRIDQKLSKLAAAKKERGVEWVSPAWLPLFAIMQLGLTWALFFK